MSFRDRRSAERLPLKTEARCFPGGQACIVADVSPDGARLLFAPGQDTPDPQVLAFWKTGQAFEVEAVWWRPNEIGVRFIRTCHLGARAPDIFHAAQAAWRERTPRPALEGA